MSNTSSNGQVQLSKLIFTQSWEDPAIDERVLKIKEGDTIFTITSGGCNALGFLRFSPAAIFCVDINPAQNYLMELKMASFKEFDYDTMCRFIGLRKCNSRIMLFNSLKKHLSKDALRFWEGNLDIIKKGILMNGRYEKFVKLAGRLMRLVQGSKKIKTLFQLQSLNEQEKFYDEHWDNSRWQWVFKLMFNKRRLAKRGLTAEYFHFDDGSSSFSESFYKRASHVMKGIPIRDNYFISLYFLGHYLNEASLPEYLKQENFESIKRNIDKIHLYSQDSKYWLEQQAPHTFDAFALSNICELMDYTDTHKLFTEVVRTAKPNAKIIFRNLMIPREVPEDLRQHIVEDEVLSKELRYTDRSFVYGKVAAYKVVSPELFTR
jgi:S-adenosylmethionine-diacylglycerol 3-amino-3-carboxypropyl transferase